MFLQGPHGPFFKELGLILRAQGYSVHRVNFNVSDCLDWYGKDTHAFFWRPKNWILWLEQLIQKYPITDLVLYGDCRPLHKEAIDYLKARGVIIHILEEGYIRPHWVTYERDGVNGNSRLKKMMVENVLPRSKKSAYFSQKLGKTTQSQVYYCIRHYAPQWLVGYIFPFARTHRMMGSFPEAMLWIKRFFGLKKIKARADAQAQQLLASQRPYFLLPLQLDSDYQIRVHSPYSSMLDGIWRIMESFAEHSKKTDLLVIKNHPLDNGFIRYGKHITGMAKDLKVEDRVIYIDGGPFHDLVTHAKAMVVINSTSGFQAMRHGIPTKVLGDSIYDIPGIASSQSLNQFWKKQDPVDLEQYRMIRELLLETCQINGSFYTKRGRALLSRRLPELLTAPDEVLVRRVELSNRKGVHKVKNRIKKSDGKVVSIGFF